MLRSFDGEKLSTHSSNMFRQFISHFQLLLPNAFMPRLSYQESIRLIIGIAECARSAQCAPFKHHFDECAERVREQEENPDHAGPKEDCVEECEFDPYLFYYDLDSQGHL